MKAAAQQLPDIGGYFYRMGLVDKIEKAIFWDNSDLANEWRQKIIAKNYGNTNLLKEISQQAQDNRPLVSSMIGEGLLNEIEKLDL